MIPGPGTRPLRTVRLLESRPLVAVGIASFSVFLWHHPVIMWLSTHGLTVGGRGGLLVNLIVVALIVGVLSALTYRFIERPALRRKRSTRKATAPASDPRKDPLDQDWARGVEGVVRPSAADDASRDR
jgi:peptidoglycan/LPS O-acetylase OafA/YrhL